MSYYFENSYKKPELTYLWVIKYDLEGSHKKVSSNQKSNSKLYYY